MRFMEDLRLDHEQCRPNDNGSQGQHFTFVRSQLSRGLLYGVPCCVNIEIPPAAAKAFVRDMKAFFEDIEASYLYGSL